MNTREKIENNKINDRSDVLTDLSVADDQGSETKGGTIPGGRGSDVLIGGSGNDWLSGGSGRD